MKTKAFNLRIDTLILRFYLLMAIVIIAGFTGIWSLAILALPVFMTCLLGVDLGWKSMNRHTKMAIKRTGERIRHASAPAHQPSITQ